MPVISRRRQNKGYNSKFERNIGRLRLPSHHPLQSLVRADFPFVTRFESRLGSCETLVRMATTYSPLPSPAPPTPPTPSSAIYPSTLSRLRETTLDRSASSSSSRSTTTTSSTSSLVAAPIRPPPIETSTASTSSAQLPSRSQSTDPYSSQHRGSYDSGGYGNNQGESSRTGSGPPYHSPGAIYGGRGFQRNGPRIALDRSANITPIPPLIISNDLYNGPIRSSSVPLPVSTTPSRIPPQSSAMTASSSASSRADSVYQDEFQIYAQSAGLSPTTPRASRFPNPDEIDAQLSSPTNNTTKPNLMVSTVNGSNSPRRTRDSFPSSPTTIGGGDRFKQRALSSSTARGDGSRDLSRERRQSVNSSRSAVSSSGRVRENPSDYVFGEELGRGSYSTVSTLLLLSKRQTRKGCQNLRNCEGLTSAAGRTSYSSLILVQLPHIP